ncbi:MAG: VOC family protein [Myxococcales bacterium]|nr:MAG: VOC family protein [Myxococcales bacterium]
MPEAPADPVRLHLDLLGGAEQQEVVDRLLAERAAPLDIGQGDVPWVVLADVEGNPFCVMEERAVYSATGPIAALPMDSADPERDGALWQWLTGWVRGEGAAPVSLRHPSGTGPLLELCPEAEPKGSAKNRLHLDLRLEEGEDAEEVTREIERRGGRVVDHDWGDLPWTVYVDGSGNEFCVLH